MTRPELSAENAAGHLGGSAKIPPLWWNSGGLLMADTAMF